MNYYNPYIYTVPSNIPSRVGLLSRIFGGRNISFSSILSGTQKTLGVVNQAIPLVKQVHPMVKNAKTMFKVMNEFKKSNSKQHITNHKNNNSNNSNNSNNIDTAYQPKNNINNQGPTFFV